MRYGNRLKNKFDPFRWCRISHTIANHLLQWAIWCRCRAMIAEMLAHENIHRNASRKIVKIDAYDKRVAYFVRSLCFAATHTSSTQIRVKNFVFTLSLVGFSDWNWNVYGKINQIAGNEVKIVANRQVDRLTPNEAKLFDSRELNWLYGILRF